MSNLDVSNQDEDAANTHNNHSTTKIEADQSTKTPLFKLSDIKDVKT